MAYIDKENLIKELEKHFDILRGEDGRLLYSDHICTGEDVDDLLELVKDLPTADVIEVKRGKWKIKRDEYDCEYMVCSCCKEEFYPFDADTVDTTPNYCPNCGADMRGGKNDL